ALQPVFGDAVAARLFDDGWIVRVKEDIKLGLIEILLVRHTRRLLDAVGIVEHDAEIPDAPDTSLRTHRWLPGLDARIAEDALLGFSARPVVINLLVRTAGNAQPRQIHHEGGFELAVDVLLHTFEIHVLRALGEFPAQNLLPVRAPLDLLHALAAD